MAFVQSPPIAPPISTGAMNFGSIQNNWDAIMEDFDAVAYLPFGDEYFDAMNQIMNAVGNREIAKNPRVRWFEMTRMEAPITVTATGAGPYTVTLDGTSITTVNGVDYSWPAVGDIWRNASTGALYQITAKNPLDAAEVTMAALITTGAAAPAGLMFYVGNSAGENTGAYASKFTFDTVHTSPLQTFRNDTTSSSEALYNQLWYSQLENGVQTPYSNSRDIIYLQREHQVALVNTFFAGVPSTSTGYNATIQPTSFQTTQGLVNAIENNQSGSNGGGINTVISVGAAPGTTLDVEDFYAMEAALTSQDGSVKNYMVWTSGYMQGLLERALFTGASPEGASAFNYNVTVNKVQMEKTFWGEGAYADLMSRTFSFNNLVFNNKNFAFVRMGIFDNPTMFGAGADSTENPWKQYAFFIPLSTNGGVDDGMGNMGKYIRVCHKPGAFMNMWQTGGRAAANKTDVWQLGVHIVSEVGYKFVNSNKYGLFTV